MAEHVWQKLAEGVHSPALDFRKPLLIYWFMSHVIKYVIASASLSTVVAELFSFRALVLWETDPTLIIALEASKTFCKRTEYLMMFWPSDGTLMSTDIATAH